MIRFDADTPTDIRQLMLMRRLRRMMLRFIIT